MYKTMLVLLDGSELAEVVLKYAQELSARLNLSVELLHVCDRRDAAQLPMRRAYMERAAEILCAGAEEVRAKYRIEHAEPCSEARGHVVVGHPDEEILRYIDERDIDLVMMSTHGRSGIKAWDLGGVASKVVHASRVPIWLVPSEIREEVIWDTLPKRLLVVPLTGSEQSVSAIPHAVSVAKQRGGETELVLLHVHDVEGLNVAGSALDEGAKQRADMKDYLESLAGPIRATGLLVRTEVLIGDPATTIINYLRDNPTQLIAMATRGRTGLSRLVFGSVTENVVHMVKKTPMLLVAEGD